MPYGKVRLSRDDWAFVREILDRRAGALPAQRDGASSDHERAFYVAAIDEAAKLSAKVGGDTKGKLSFSERELRTLRGYLFASERSEVAKAFHAAIESGDNQAHASLRERLAKLELLDTPLSKPFEMDRSQDAEGDESDDEDEENVEN